MLRNNKPKTLARLKLDDVSKDVYIIRWRKGSSGPMFAQILYGTRDQVVSRKHNIVRSNGLGYRDLIYLRKVRGFL